MSTLATAAAALALIPGACAGAGHPYTPGVNCRVLEVDGHPRRFVAYVPRRRPARAPVVLMFHGSSGTGEQFLRISGWREQADATGLVAVFPTGLRYHVLDGDREHATKWNGFELAGQVDLADKPPGYPADAPWPADDVGFTDAILADLEAQLPIDERRIFASGFSNGADFAARLAVERSTTFAAAGLVAGGLRTAQTPARPVPTSLVVGTLDEGVTAQSGVPELPLDPAELLALGPIASTVDAHLATAGLARHPFAALRGRRSTALRWPGTGDPLLRFTVLAGLHHHYPNGNGISGGFRAAPEFWKFFRAAALSGRRRVSFTASSSTA
jgi:polyhydroxybutyrate depolymerase